MGKRTDRQLNGSNAALSTVKQLLKISTTSTTIQFFFDTKYKWVECLTFVMKRVIPPTVCTSLTALSTAVNDSDNELAFSREIVCQ